MHAMPCRRLNIADSSLITDVSVWCIAKLLRPDSVELAFFLKFKGPIYKISYDLSYDHRTFIVRPTYHSDLKRAEISLRYIVS